MKKIVSIIFLLLFTNLFAQREFYELRTYEIKWGINYQIDSLKSDISSNNWTNAYGIAQKFHSTGYTANEASANAYITALNNFQDHGVIVYALSNTSSYTDADF